MRVNFPTVLAVSSVALLGLAACNAPEDAPAETLEVETPPVETVSEVEEVAAPDMVESDAVTVTEDAATVEDDHDHTDEDHDEHDHDHKDDHDHEDDHDHADEDDHDHGVGEAHVHGTGEMVIVLDGSTLSVSLEAPLASFASFEHEPQTAEQEQELQSVRDGFMRVVAMVEINAQAGCDYTARDVGFRHMGNHGSLMVDYAFECAAPDELSTIDVGAFAEYPALETVDVIFLNGAYQLAKTLTVRDNRVSLK